MPSKMVVDREKTAAVLRGALKVHASKASEKFLEILEPDLREDEATPDMECVQRLLRRRLDRLRAQMVRADDANGKDLEVMRGLREKRDAAVAEVAHLVARLRFMLMGLCGRPICARILGFDGNTPRDPVVLHRVAGRLVENLRRGTLPLPSSGLGGQQIDPAAWVQLLEEPTERLGEALQELALEHQDVTTTMLDKREAMAAYDHAYRATARMLQELYRYVGMTELAERVAPTRRRKRKLAPQEPQQETQLQIQQDTRQEAQQETQIPILLRLFSGLLS